MQLTRKCMKISIITPCYNSENTIEQAILSVIVSKNDDIEMIIVDDGSVDGTAEICKKYIGSNIHYYKTENMGAGHARNIGISKAKGKWITFLDSDDLYFTHCFNTEFNRLLDVYDREGVDVIYTPKVKVDMELEQKPISTYPEEIEDIKYCIPKLEFWTCIYRTEFLTRNEIKFYEYKKQDIDTAFRYLAFYKADKIVKNNKMCFYLQRNNLMSTTHTWNLYDLYEIKGKVYFDLFNKTNNKRFDLRLNLLKICIFNVYSYFKLCFTKGYNNLNSYKEMIFLFICINAIKKEELSFSLRVKIFSIKCMMFVSKFYFNNNLKPANHKPKNMYNSLKEISGDILLKLEQLSNQFVIPG